MEPLKNETATGRRGAKGLLVAGTAVAAGAGVALVVSSIFLEHLNSIVLPAPPPPAASPPPSGPTSDRASQPASAPPHPAKGISPRRMSPSGVASQPFFGAFKHEGFIVSGDSVRVKKSFREAMLAQPQKAMILLAGAKIAPLVKDGKIEGYPVSHIKPGTLLYNAGLRNGDTVVAINGQSVADPGKTLQQLLSLTSANSGTVRLRRHNTTRTIHVSLID